MSFLLRRSVVWTQNFGKKNDTRSYNIFISIDIQVLYLGEGGRIK